MARTDNLTNYLKDVADAIREKRQITNEIPANEFDTEIRAISTGGSGDVKLFETQEEMQSDENPKEGDLAVVYRQEIQNFQEDTVTQFMTFPETVVLDEAYTDSAYGTLRSVDSSSGYFDGNVQLSQTSFRFDGYGMSEMIRVQYTSTDGITYTRTTMEPSANPIDFGVEVKWEQYEPFIPQFGKFMLIGGSTFEGLFEYVLNTTISGVWAKMDFVNDTITNKYYRLPSIFTEPDDSNRKPLVVVTEEELDKSGLFYNIKKCTSYINHRSTDIEIYCLADNKYYITTEVYASGSDTTKLTEITTYDFSLENPVVSQIKYSDNDMVQQLECIGHRDNGSNLLFREYVLAEATPDMQIVTEGTGVSVKYTDITSAEIGPSTRLVLTKTSHLAKELQMNKYIYATTQLSLSEVSQLLPGIVGYGKNGVVTGDGTIWSKVPESALRQYLNAPSENDIAAVKIVDQEVMASKINNFYPNTNAYSQGVYISVLYLYKQLYDLVQSVNPNDSTAVGSSLRKGYLIDCSEKPDTPLFACYSNNSVIVWNRLTNEYKVFAITLAGTNSSYCEYTNDYVITCNVNDKVIHRITIATGEIKTISLPSSSSINGKTHGRLVGSGRYYYFAKTNDSDGMVYIIDFESETITSKSINVAGEDRFFNDNFIPIPNSTDVIVFSLAYNSYRIVVNRINVTGEIVKTYLNYTNSTNGTPYLSLYDYSTPNKIILIGGGAWNNWIHAWEYDITTDTIRSCKNESSMSQLIPRTFTNKLSTNNYIVNDMQLELNFDTGILTIKKLSEHKYDYSQPNILTADSIKVESSGYRFVNLFDISLSTSDDEAKLIEYVTSSPVPISQKEYDRALTTSNEILRGGGEQLNKLKQK